MARAGWAAAATVAGIGAGALPVGVTGTELVPAVGMPTGAFVGVAGTEVAPPRLKPPGRAVLAGRGVRKAARVPPQDGVVNSFINSIGLALNFAIIGPVANEGPKQANNFDFM